MKKWAIWHQKIQQKTNIDMYPVKYDKIIKNNSRYIIVKPEWFSLKFDPKM